VTSKAIGSARKALINARQRCPRTSMRTASPTIFRPVRRQGRWQRSPDGTLAGHSRVASIPPASRDQMLSDSRRSPRAHRAQVLVAAAGPRRAQDRRHRSLVPLRPRSAADARLH
jgi:hypothetical protein